MLEIEGAERGAMRSIDKKKKERRRVLIIEGPVIHKSLNDAEPVGRATFIQDIDIETCKNRGLIFFFFLLLALDEFIILFLFLTVAYPVCINQIFLTGSN